MFIDRGKGFTGDKTMHIVLWSTRNFKYLLSLRDKVAHRSCVIYIGDCSCKLSYMGEIKRNSEVRWKKDKYLAGKPEPAKHFSRFYLEIILGSNLTILYNNNSSCILYCTNEACIK